MHYLVSMSFQTFCCFSCCWYSALICDDQAGCRLVFIFLKIFWDLLYVQICGQFWRKFHELLRSKYILLCLDKMFCNYLPGSLSLWRQLASVFLCFVSVWMTCLLARVGRWSLPHQCVRVICDLSCNRVSSPNLGAVLFGA